MKRNLVLVVGLLLLFITASHVPPTAAASTSTPTPLASGTAPVITAGNAARLAPTARLGRGQIRSVAWSPDYKLLAVATTRGLWLQPVDPPDAPPSLLEMDSSACCATFSQDGSLLAAGSREGSVHIWDMATRQLLSTLKGHTDFIYGVAFSPDKKLLASSSYDATVIVWDVAAQRAKTTLNARAKSPDVAFSPDGSLLVYQDINNEINLWDVTTGKVLAVHDDDGPNAVDVYNGVASFTFSPDGKTLAVGKGHQGAVVLWDVATHRVLSTFEGHAYEVSSLAFSPDGKRLAACDGREGSVIIWDITKHRSLWKGHDCGDTSHNLAFSDSLLALSTANNTLKLVDVTTGTTRAELGGYTYSTFYEQAPMVISGTNVFTSSGARDILVWDRLTGEVQRTLSGEETILSTALSPDRAIAAAGGDKGGVYLWDVETGAARPTLHVTSQARITSLTFSPDGKTLAAGAEDNSVTLWDMPSGQQRAVLTGTKAYPYDNLVRVVFSPDGSLLAAVGRVEYRVYSTWLWETATGKRLNLWTANGVTFTPDGKQLVLATGDGNVRLWNIQTRQERVMAVNMGRLEEAAVDLTVDPKGAVLAALPIRFDESSLRLWSLTRRQRLASPPCLWRPTPIVDPSFYKRSVAFSLDGSVMACPSAEGKVIVWDVGGGKTLATLQTRLTFPYDLTFSDDGTILASGDSGGIVQLWAVGP